jgi:hypothetical protein
MFIPKPVLTLAVGVTGHRSSRLKDDQRARIARQLADVYANIEAECRTELNRRKEFYVDDRAPCLYLVSSLADGADALAVQQCPAHWTTVGLLPCPEERYVEILGNTVPPGGADRAVAEFAAARGRAKQIVILPQSHPQDVNGLGRSRDLLLRQIDVLIAVWDGGLPEHAGGTADVVERATETGIPVIWIAAEKSQPPWAISRPADVARETPMADATTGPIAEIVRRELGVGDGGPRPKEPWNIEPRASDAIKRLREFFKEDIPGSGEDMTRIWEPFLREFPRQGGFAERISDILQPRFLVADRLATHYGRLYRQAYISAYLLSALAVGLAVISFVLYGHNIHDTTTTPSEGLPPGEIVLATLELLSVALIVAIVWCGLRNRWHDRWLDYRALAETLRHLRFLGPFCQYEKRAYLEAAARTGAAWILWYFRATMRELGMPSGDLGPDYQRGVLRAIVAVELESQVKYHAENSTSRRRQHRMWHMAGDACFAGALLILFLFLGAYWISPADSSVATDLFRIAPIVTALTAFLPALGAACAGIRFTGDFEGDAERSARTGAQLDKLQQRYEVALDRLDFDASAAVVFESARIMATDINGWTSMYCRKHLSLPG